MKLRVLCPKCGSTMAHPNDLPEMAVLQDEKVPLVCEVCTLEAVLTVELKVK